MNGYVKKFLMAAVLMAALAGCTPDGPTDIEDQKATLSAITDFTIKGTQVHFAAAVQYAINPVLRWYDGNPTEDNFLCTGNPCTAFLSVGTHTITVVLTADNGTDQETATATILPADIIITSTTPANGDRLVTGEAWECAVEYYYDPHPDLESTISWKLDGQPTTCGEDLSVGSHTLEVSVSSIDGTHSASATISFEVVPEPPQIVFAASALGGDFRVASLTGGSVSSTALMPAGETKTWPDISPDGTKVVYVKNDGELDEDGISRICELFVYTIATGVEERLEFGPAKNCRAPVWSPNGDKIAFSGQYKDNPDFESGHSAIFVVNADGSNFRLIPSFECSGDWSNTPCRAGTGSLVQWHSEGLIFSISEALLSLNSRQYVSLVDVETGEDIRRLHEDPISAQRAIDVYGISPDNRLVSVFSWRNNEIRVVRTDGSGTVGVFQAQRQAFFCGGSDWMYYTDRDRNGKIRRVRPDGTGDEFFTSVTNASEIWTPRCIPPRD